LAFLERARGQAGAAEAALQEAHALAPGMRRTAFLAHQDAQARLWGREPDFEAGLRWAEAAGLAPEAEIRPWNEAGMIALSRLLFLSGELEMARRLLARLRRVAGESGRAGRLVEILVLQALATHRQGELDAAVKILEECLALARPEGYLRVFADEGEPMRILLKVAVSRLKVPELREYASRLLMQFEVPGPIRSEIEGHLLNLQKDDPPIRRNQPSTFDFQPATLIEPLSERELDVLRLMAAGLSNQEIARELIVAPSTVHWHTKNIYSKMNVHSRTQASWQARQMGLFG
jgi:LuxR family maltose regulon positive regulatory protein